MHALRALGAAREGIDRRRAKRRVAGEGAAQAGRQQVLITHVRNRRILFRVMVATQRFDPITRDSLLKTAAHFRIARAADDEEAPQEALVKLLDAAKINLQQGLAAGEQEGQPISAKFEVDQGKLQL
jgi:hypothetical protein